MNRIRKLATAIQPYAWGSRSALAALQGRSAPTAQPEAELWVGAHPMAPSSVESEEGLVPLSEWIARDPETALGPDLLARSGPELPFLLKILAVAEPLSLQAHPGGAQAAEGFAREEEAGVARDAAARCYRDPHAKAEMVCALGEFETLLGFRPVREILERFDALALDDLGPALDPLRRSPNAEGWRTSFTALLGLGADVLGPAVAGAAQAAADASDPGLAWLPRLAAAHPVDPGVFAPVYLAHRSLTEREAALIPPGMLHTHLHGLCVEVMTASDNVLRGGLTPKPVAREELLRALDFGAPAPHPVPAREGAEAPYPSPSPSFALWRLCPEPEAPRRLPGAAGLLLCTEGSVALVREAEPASRLDLGPGQAAWIPAGAGPARLEGRGEAWRAGSPVAAEGAGA